REAVGLASIFVSSAGFQVPVELVRVRRYALVALNPHGQFNPVPNLSEQFYLSPQVRATADWTDDACDGKIRYHRSGSTCCRCSTSDAHSSGGFRTMEMNAWQLVVHALEAEGVPFVFGLPGNPTHLYDQLYDSNSVRPILVRHETSGSFMAMAHARITGQIGCCFGCPGPGVANLVPGILEAFSGCTPVLALGVRASRKTEGMGAFQETDHLGMMRPITKWAVTLERADRIGWTIRRAISIATSGKPGPVYVEIPADIALEPVEMPEYIPSDRSIQPGPDADKIEQLLDLLEQSKRPIMVCGGGSVLSRAFAEVEAIADGLGIPILVTPAGRGIIAENHPLFAGSVGLYRTEYPRSVYQEADLLITVGSRMEEFQSGIWNYFPT